MEQKDIDALAKELGFAKMGICSTKAFDVQKETVNSQPELRERRQLHFDPQQEYPWARTLLVLLWPYQQAVLPHGNSSIFVDSYYAASNQAYLAARLLEQKLCDLGLKAKANVSYPAKAAAIRAGLGVIGENGLLITPEYGTRVVIILLAVDASIAAHKEEKLDMCIRCGRCVDACPVGALDHQGMSHPERCLRNYMMEGIVVPENIRSLMGMKLIGCDICQRVCPMQQSQTEIQETKFDLDMFLTDNDALFKESVSRLGNIIGKNTARPQRVRAQAALLAGNRKCLKDLPILYAWSQSEFEPVRVHSQWAIEQIERKRLGLDQSEEKR